jgi:glycerophosphoryl diester phosphodiesterase
MKNMIAIWGHRGCRGKGNPPENSLPAFEAAIRQGAEGVELDVLCSKDHQLIVFHDEDLVRMTDGEGKVASRTLPELRKLRLRDSSGALTDVTIPTLAEVLRAIERSCAERNASDFVVNIEIKSGQDPTGATLVAETIKHERLQGAWKSSSLQVSSFDTAVLHRIRASAPDIPLGALLEGGKEPRDISEDLLEQRLREFGDLRPESINIMLPSLTPRAVQIIRSMDAIPIAWTCNEVAPKALTALERQSLKSTLLNSGIACLITDYPGEMRTLLNSPR